MKEIGKIVAGICAFFFVLSGVLTLLLFNIEQKAFSSETYKQSFKELGLYAQTPSLIANLITDPANGSMPAMMSLLNKNELAFVISSILPPAEIETMTNNTLDSTFDFINGKSDSVSISLLPFKQSMAGEGGMSAFLQILQAQPACTPEQIIQMGLGLLSANTDLKICNPPQEVLQLVMPVIQEQIQQISQSIPETLTLVSSDQVEASNFRTRLDRIRTGIKLSFLLPLFLLIAIILFAVRSLQDWLKWWGIPFLATGIFTLILAFIGVPLVRFVIKNIFLENKLQAGISEIVQNVIDSVARQILVPVAIEGAFLAFIGAGMVAGFWVYNKMVKSTKP
ncbi:MAG: hypothetical protein IPP66_19025 [Anaerolineales bacterium]|nr:hypothetical protein [Anaerolineales bacterium]